MKIPYQFIIFVLLYIALLVISVIKTKKSEDGYDERQELIRGKAYKLGFLAIVFFLFSYIIAVSLYENLREYSFLIAYIGIFLGFSVFGVYSIINDAFLSLKQKPATYLTLIIILTIGNLIGPVWDLIKGTTFNEIISDHRVLNLLCGSMFFVVTVALIIKTLQTRREADE